MRTTITIILVSALILSCSKREIRETKYENGQIKEKYSVIQDKNGNFLRDGEYIKYYENGQKEEEKNYKNGKAEGLYKFWYKNGQLGEEYNFKDGEVNGLVKMWYKSGQKKSEVNHINNKIEGKVTVWEENGEIEGVYTYKNGEKIDDGEAIEEKEDNEPQETASSTERTTTSSTTYDYYDIKDVEMDGRAAIGKTCKMRIGMDYSGIDGGTFRAFTCNGGEMYSGCLFRMSFDASTKAGVRNMASMECGSKAIFKITGKGSLEDFTAKLIEFPAY